MNLLGFGNYDDLKYSHYKWVEGAIQTDNFKKESKWAQSIAVGSKAYIEKMKKALGYKAKGRKIIDADDTFELREAVAPFGDGDNLDSENIYLWNHQPSSLIGQFLHEN
jgi:putative transposase